MAFQSTIFLTGPGAILGGWRILCKPFGDGILKMAAVCTLAKRDALSVN
jgi:hypothetical protein